MALVFDNLYFSGSSGLTASQFFDRLKQDVNFWTETTATTAKVGDITITFDNSNSKLTISGYGYSFDYGLASTSYWVLIAATETCVMFTRTNLQSFVYAVDSVMIGQNEYGEWGAVFFYGASKAITKMIAPNVTSINYKPTTGNYIIQASTINTQFMDISTAFGDFTFKDVYSIVMTPQTDYVGRILMADGTRYVKIGCMAMKYTYSS